MSFEDHIQIERFLKNELSEEERTGFLERIDTDDTFRKKVVFEQQLFNAFNDANWSHMLTKEHAKISVYETILKNKETQKIKTKIAKAQKLYKEGNSNKKATHKLTAAIYLRWIGAIAAICIISFSIFHYLNPERINHKELLKNAWNKNVGLDFVVRTNSGVHNDTELLLKALTMYENKQFDGALSILKEYDTKSDNYKNALLLKALCRHKVNQTTRALKTLDTLENYSPDISKWYKGLMYLEIDSMEKAKLYIEVPNQNNGGIKFKK